MATAFSSSLCTGFEALFFSYVSVFKTTGWSSICSQNCCQVAPGNVTSFHLRANLTAGGLPTRNSEEPHGNLRFSEDAINDDQFINIFIEIVNLLLNITLRYSIGYFDKNTCDKVFGELHYTTVRDVVNFIFTRASELEKESLVVGIMIRYVERQDEYSQYKLLSSEDDGLSGSLLTASAQMINSILNRGFDIFSTMKVVECLNDALMQTSHSRKNWLSECKNNPTLSVEIPVNIFEQIKSYFEAKE